MQTAQQIELGIRTSNDHDSTLIVRLTVDPKIPDDSLNADRANEIINSFITLLPNLKSFTACRVIFIRKTGSVVTTTRTIEFLCPITPEVLTRVANYKDSTKVSLGYIDSSWNYINKDLKLSVKLKNDWFYVSRENDSLVYYPIGSDVSQLPQYRTDEDRRVPFQTLLKQFPTNPYPVFWISKNKMLPMGVGKGKDAYQGPTILAGLIKYPQGSEDEYLKDVYQILLSQKLTDAEIHSFFFGNASFRGTQPTKTQRYGTEFYNLTVIRQFRSVGLLLTIYYSNEKELKEIKSELSDLKIGPP